jgi:hypothetical protein
MDTAAVSSDLHQWALDTARAVRERRFEEIDCTRLAEELDDLASSEERALESHLAQLLYHLLKIEFQPERHGRSWDLTVREQRNSIRRLLEKQPSLKALLLDGQFLAGAYDNALALSGPENLPDAVVAQFPEQCPYKPEMLLTER